jgi:peptidyl-dipeptidase A
VSVGEARAFVEEVTARIVPLEVEANRAAWDVATGGGDPATERVKRARTALRAVFCQEEDGARVRGWLGAGDLADPLLHRQLVVLDLEYTRNRLPLETVRDLVDRQSALERVFYDFRARLDGERVSNNRLIEILRGERDGAVRRAAWQASKQIGAEVAAPLRDLVRRRNDAARSIGFRDAFAMDLALQEIREDELFDVLDGYAELGDGPFARFRDEVDAGLAARFGIGVGDLRPWHWPDPFGQEAPPTGATDPDAWFAGVDVVRVAADFFAGIGLGVEDILARSDLWEREGKDQHAFATDIDRAGDVRILCNLRPNERWASTLLHELGHAVYDERLPRELPFLLRTPAHTLSTESVAMFFGRLTRDPAWLRDAAGVVLDAVTERETRRALRAAMLISTRWMLVMTHFERALYADPDRADLNRVWWQLVERFQRIRYPEADPLGTEWAAKMHLSLAPVYYHNYLLGELMASQVTDALHEALGVEGPEGIVGRPEAGSFFAERIFSPGGSVDWNGLMIRATGRPLEPSAFVRQFVDGG